MPTEIPEIVRRISGKGVITITEDFEEALQIYLYVQVLRESSSVSRNFTWNPDRSFFAHVTFCIDDYVLWEYDVNFDKQAFLIHDGQASQNLLSLICAYDGVLDSFVQVGQILGTVLSRTNLITSHPYLRFQPNRIRFECFGSTALVLTLKGTKLEKCRPEDGTPVPPPPPPPPVSPIPPGEPTEVSDPEDGLDDGGDTVPFPDDEFEGGDPVPGACNFATLAWTLTNEQFPAGTSGTTIIGLPFEGFLFSPGANAGSSNVDAVASQTIDGFCVPGQLFSLFQNVSDVGLEIVATSIVPLA